ncbi:hypothetical protein ACFCYX_04685 [Streptomyces populi]|uniref:hypothetical protein n=1 Tax=Streptomyces populi TaxID=2058924 RepID=UPI0013A6B4EE|nr:hypothetical protein [Streptomyces populi]
MGRRRYRQLVMGHERFRWWVSHRHVPAPDSGSAPGHACQEVLAVTREGSPGAIRIVFASGPGRVVGGGGWGAHEGGVSRAGGGYLNLHRPATVRELIEEVLADGQRFGHAAQVDGWRFFDAAAARVPPERPDPSPGSSA